MTLISSEISIDCCKNGCNTDSLKRLLSVHAYMVTWRRKCELGKKSFSAFIYKFCVYVTSDLYMTHNSHIRFPISDIRTGVNKPFIFSTPEYTWLMCGISALSVIVFQIFFFFFLFCNCCNALTCAMDASYSPDGIVVYIWWFYWKQITMEMYEICLHGIDLCNKIFRTVKRQNLCRGWR